MSNGLTLSGEIVRAENNQGGAKRAFKAPFTGDAVLYLWR
jgi:hypothetical protein